MPPANSARIAYTGEQIQARVKELALQIQADLSGRRPVLVSVLKGSVVFLADLVRNLAVDPDIDFMSISSYGEPGGGFGVVRILKDLEEPIEGRPVVVIEDVVDTGLSLSYLVRTLQNRGPAELAICTLVSKSARRIAEVEVKYSGFQSEDFLVGYGLDFKGRFRNLPCLMAVRDAAVLAADPSALDRMTEQIFGPSEGLDGGSGTPAGLC